MSKNGAYEFNHVGHEKLEATQVVRRIGDLSDDSFEATSNLLENHCAASMTRQFLELTAGGRLSPNSVAKLRQCVLMMKFNSNSSEITVEDLLSLLEEDEDTLCVTCTGSYDDSSNLVEIRKAVKNLTKAKMLHQPKCMILKLNHTQNLLH